MNDDGYESLGQPSLWVQCTCGTPYVYRRSFTFGTGSLGAEWLWQRDCKNTRDKPAKAHQPRMWTADGEYVAPADNAEAVT